MFKSDTNAIAPSRFLTSGSIAPRLFRVGQSGEPVIVIDNVLQDIDALIDFASEKAVFKPADENRGGYPGIRAAAPLDYAMQMLRLCDPIIRSLFPQLEGRPVIVANNLSLVTTSFDALHPLQKVPHIDTSSPLSFAFLHIYVPPILVEQLFIGRIRLDLNRSPRRIAMPISTRAKMT